MDKGLSEISHSVLHINITTKHVRPLWGPSGVFLGRWAERRGHSQASMKTRVILLTVAQPPPAYAPRMLRFVFL